MLYVVVPTDVISSQIICDSLSCLSFERRTYSFRISNMLLLEVAVNCSFKGFAIKNQKPLKMVPNDCDKLCTAKMHMKMIWNSERNPKRAINLFQTLNDRCMTRLIGSSTKVIVRFLKGSLKRWIYLTVLFVTLRHALRTIPQSCGAFSPKIQLRWVKKLLRHLLKRWICLTALFVTWRYIIRNM